MRKKGEMIRLFFALLSEYQSRKHQCKIQYEAFKSDLKIRYYDHINER